MIIICTMLILSDKLKAWRLSRHIFMPVLSQDLDFQHHMSWHFFVLSDLRKEAVFRFVVIGRIIEHSVVKNSQKKEKKKNLKN